MEERIVREEMDFADVAGIVWRSRKYIVAIACASGLVFLLASMFLVPPKYTSRMSIYVNIPEDVSTKYGTVKMEKTVNLDYGRLIDSEQVVEATVKDLNIKGLTIKKAKKQIRVSEKDAPNFLVQIEGGSPEEARNIANSLFLHYRSHIEAISKKNFINRYIQRITDSIDGYRNELLEYQKLYEASVRRLDMMDQTAKQEGRNSLDGMALKNTLGYYQAAQESMEIRKKIEGLEIGITLNLKYLDELDNEKEIIEKYSDSENLEKIKKLRFDTISQYIILSSEASLPLEKSSPSGMTNAFIGTMVGLFGASAWFFVRAICELKAQNRYLI